MVNFNIVVSLSVVRRLSFQVSFMLVKFTVQFGFANVRVCLDPMVSPFGLVGVPWLLLHWLFLHFVSTCVSIATEQQLLQSLLLDKLTLRIRRQLRLLS